MANQPHYLVVDGYAREGREDLRAGGATTAAQVLALDEERLELLRIGHLPALAMSEVDLAVGDTWTTRVWSRAGRVHQVHVAF